MPLSLSPSRIGLSLGSGSVSSTVVAGGGAGPLAPVVAFDTPITNPPAYVVQYSVLNGDPYDTVPGDVVRMEITDAGDNYFTYDSAALTQDNIDNQTASFDIGSDTYVAGDADVRMRIVRDSGAVLSPWSSIVTGTLPAAGYTETPVTFDGTNDYMERGGALTGVVDGRTALIFISVEFANAASAIEYLLKGAGTQGPAIYRDASGYIQVQQRDTGGALDINLIGATTVIGAERVNILAALDADGTSYLYLWEAGGGTVEETSDASGGGGDLDFTPANFFFGANGGNFKFTGDALRVAAWFNPTSLPDITQSSVRDKFFNSSTGALVDPATSVSAYGTPQIARHGVATVWNTTGNQGDGGDFTMNGAVVDA